MSLITDPGAAVAIIAGAIRAAMEARLAQAYTSSTEAIASGLFGTALKSSFGIRGAATFRLSVEQKPLGNGVLPVAVGLLPLESDLGELARIP